MCMAVMSTRCLLLLGIFSTLELISCQQSGSRTDCGECDTSSCHPPQTCLAGMVKDSCDCCYLCGRKEGQLCDHRNVPSNMAYGTCGENLECRMRTDLDPEDPPEASCFCTKTYPLCGSDGVTYDNICQLTEARYQRRDGLRAVSREPCRSAPKIVSAPQNQRNSTGSYVAMPCEATGWPLPEIKWTAQKPGNETVVTLPGTNSRMVIHTRNGSGYEGVTSWLLIANLSPEDAGRYCCVAENDVGSTAACAFVYVIPS